MDKNLGLKNALFLLVATGCLTAGASAQNKKTAPPAQGTTPPPAAAPAPPKSGPKAYKDVITDKALTRKGLFTVHKVDDKWFFELGDTLLNQDILVVNRISKGAIDTRSQFFGYAGDEINENVIRFEKGPNNKIFLRNISFSVYSRDTSKPMYKTVQNSNVQPIVASFEVKAFSKDSAGSVIDMTDFINGDNDVFFFASSTKSALRLGGVQPDKSYIVDIRSFPINTEIKTVKTYSKSPAPSLFPGAPAGPGGNATLELNTSIVALPKVPMRPRYYDDRVAYFTTEFTDFDADPQGVKDISMVTRWRLEPKPEDVEKMKRGELVEPIKPIVYYIDPATPAKWVPYLVQGVNDWQKAFEKAGFKNAIVAKIAPTPQEDSSWSLEDARYSAIVYKPSDIPNAMGPHVHDPRTGEILESHINWYHNVMSLLRNWYLIQASPSDPNARKAHFDDELMGQLIRFVSSHEVGHTLGLPHNMGASAATPVEKLRDKAWVEANGHTSSIMDYARFNYVAQPGDNIGAAGLYPRIGSYDLWSIEWGYKPIFDKSEDEEKAILNDWVKARANDPYLRFIHADGQDPRAQTESLGDNAMKASDYGIRNLKWMLPQIQSWVNEKGEDYKLLADIYGEVYGQFSRYIGHVITNIGGVYTDKKTTDQSGAIYTVVPKTTQKEALGFLAKNVLETPTWLLNKEILDRINNPSQDRLSGLQEQVLSGLLSINRLTRMNTATLRDASAYRLEDYMDDVKKAIWSELPTRKTIDFYRRLLQKSYVDKLGAMVAPPAAPAPISMGGMVISMGGSSRSGDAPAIARAQLKALKAEIAAALPAYSDRMSRYHLQELNEKIDRILNPNK
ncbi:MAG: zinc-dependent metalloprotease [Candidatus Pseudobacter hemicellulosilyticus]|uniref:Zinc-dependent metalloprotease n=1 Tax=Candidatus Pseudobacter hemicellulosilyticus TaxID=3121375 RepID=A0AAJ5WV57_9BACT|nr:MAG: zinc-dependent metalloprotease [Pseudobacter sp.]